MSDSFEFTLHSPMTKEDWNKLSDVEFENTPSVTFQTPQGRQVRYIKCEVLDKIREEIQKLRNCSCSNSDGIIDDVEDILDKYKAEGNDKESEE